MRGLLISQRQERACGAGSRDVAGPTAGRHVSMGSSCRSLCIGACAVRLSCVVAGGAGAFSPTERARSLFSRERVARGPRRARSAEQARWDRCLGGVGDLEADWLVLARHHFSYYLVD